ncbi:glycosyltransferase family 2 protein [Paraburkholderia mimosarum]|uniref:glycosyltransferase family 2 protein n=1 Tax=Paraburkholderia mimosarum TaxID=312026 RepID=UPI00068416D9|nr:glycosyltransferase family 2 protein [Paraburkholderia mimosarum]
MQIERSIKKPWLARALLSRCWSWKESLVAIVPLCIVMLFVIALPRQFVLIVTLVKEGDWTKPLQYGVLFLILASMASRSIHTLLWFIYRPVPAASAPLAPSLTVIIPAFNEGAMVEKAIFSVAAAEYPADRLQIIVVDDGSTDDTWVHIDRAAARHPDLVQAVRFPRNCGKRAALAEGFRRARGEVTITVDSDSIIDYGTLLAMVGPFRDPKVGAVAGKVIPFNRHAGLLPRMLHVQFTLAFDFLRSVQSTYRTVQCCPGALAAYRTDLARRILPDWESQTFLGVRCTFGEDRSLTNYILAEGYDTVFQRTTVVKTIVPETYQKLCKMYLRWGRSQIREGCRFFRILWKRPATARLIAFYDTVVGTIVRLAGYALLLPILSSIHGTAGLIRLIIAIAVTALFNTLYFLRSERSWEFAFGILYTYFALFGLTWILPYAALTVRKTSWLTR